MYQESHLEFSKHRFVFRYGVLLILMCIASPPQKILADTADSTAFQFQQQNSTYRWINTLYYTGDIANVSYLFQNHFSSTMNRIQRSREQWKDDQDFHGELFGPVMGYWDWILLGNLLWYNDEQSGYFNDMRSGEAALGVRRQYPGWRLDIHGGYMQDIRRQFIDTGPTFSGKFLLDQQNFSGYETTGNVNMRLESLDRRNNQTYDTRWLIRKKFAPGVTDGLGLNISHKTREYYLGTGVVETRRENVQQVNNRLNYQVYRPVRLLLDTQFSRKTTEIKTPFLNSPASEVKNRANYNLSNTAGIDLQWGIWTNQLRVQYDIQQNLYTSESRDTTLASGQLRKLTPPDDNGNTVQVENQMKFHLGSRDSLRLVNGITRLQYNTPDSTNYDDRDELRYNNIIEFYHLFRSGWRFLIGGEASLGHFVYLFQQKSAENHWNRVFRLYSNVHWRSNFWQWRTHAEVLANYYDYDYDKLLGQIRSLAFRHMTIQEQLSHPIAYDLQGQLMVRVQLEDQGRLDWEAFIEEMILEREIVEYEYKVAFPRWKRFRGYLGYRYQRRIDWRIQGDVRSTNERIFTTGPLIRFVYRWHNRPVISWEGALLNVSQMDGSEYSITQLQLQANWQF